MIEVAQAIPGPAWIIMAASVGVPLAIALGRVALGGGRITLPRDGGSIVIPERVARNDPKYGERLRIALSGLADIEDRLLMRFRKELKSTGVAEHEITLHGDMQLFASVMDTAMWSANGRRSVRNVVEQELDRKAWHHSRDAREWDALVDGMSSRVTDTIQRHLEQGYLSIYVAPNGENCQRAISREYIGRVMRESESDDVRPVVDRIMREIVRG